MEEIIKYLLTLPYPKVIIVVISLFSLLFPGLLFIDQYVTRWESLDTARLLLLDGALSFPLYLSFWVPFLLYFQEPAEGKLVATQQSILNALLFAGIALTLLLCLVSYFRFLIGVHISAHVVIGGIVILALLLLIDSVRDYNGRLRVIKAEIADKV